MKQISQHTILEAFRKYQDYIEIPGNHTLHVETPFTTEIKVVKNHSVDLDVFNKIYCEITGGSPLFTGHGKVPPPRPFIRIREDAIGKEFDEVSVIEFEALYPNIMISLNKVHDMIIPRDSTRVLERVMLLRTKLKKEQREPKIVALMKIFINMFYGATISRKDSVVRLTTSHLLDRYFYKYFDTAWEVFNNIILIDVDTVHVDNSSIRNLVVLMDYFDNVGLPYSVSRGRYKYHSKKRYTKLMG